MKAILKPTVLLIVILVFSVDAFSQPRKATLTLRANVYERLDKASQLIEKKDYTKARVLIDRVVAMSGLNAFEKAQVANFSAYYYFAQEEYAQSLIEYLKVVKTPEGLPAGLYNQTLYTIAQLYFQQDNFAKALV